MISVGSRDGRKGLGLGLEMEETELEEGEALCYHDGDENSTIDPDIALSYIEEKLQNVLGHFQKDFEGGVSAENLGAKFGGYGSFLPAYQRSPSWSRTWSQSEVHNPVSPRSPRKIHLEDRRPSSLASSSASPSARASTASVKASSMVNSLKSDVYVPSRHGEESSSISGVSKKSANPPDHGSLKVRIKVVSENLSTQKNAEIYSGLGLAVSPSSSLDDSPATSEGQCGKLLDRPEESLSSILEIMTTFTRGVLSPLSEDLIYLTDKAHSRIKREFKSVDKIGIESSGLLANAFHSGRSNQKVLGQKKLKSSEENDAFPIGLTNQKNYGGHDKIGSLMKKEKDADVDSLGCEELVSNALKLPLLLSCHYTGDDPAKGTSTATAFHPGDLKDGVKGSRVVKKECVDGESVQVTGRVEKLGGRMSLSGKVSESKKETLGNKIASYSQQDVLKSETSHATQKAGSIVSKGRKALCAEPTDPSRHLVVQKEESVSEDCPDPALVDFSNRGKRKPRGVLSIGERAYMSKDQLIGDCSVTSKGEKSTHASISFSKSDSHDLPKDNEKPGDRYKDFFGDVEFDEDDNESISGEMISAGRLKVPHYIGKRSLVEPNSSANEKSNVKNSEMPRPPEKDPRVSSHVPSLGNGQSSEAPTGIVPLFNDREEWVFCDKCEKWRLLPLGTNPKSLPDKWHCRMLTWLPGMNRCSIPEAVTTNSLRALYHPVASVPHPASEGQHDWLSSSVPTSAGLASVDSRYGQLHQNISVQNPTISGKKKYLSTNATTFTDEDGSNLSSNSRKKNLFSSGKDNNLNWGSLYPFEDMCGYQHIRQPSSDIEKRTDDKRDKKVSLVNGSDKGSKLKIGSKRQSTLDASSASKRIKGEELQDDENWTSDNGLGFSNAGHGSASGLANNTSGSGRTKYSNPMDSRGDTKKVSVVNPDMRVPVTSDQGLLRPGKSDNKKRRLKDTPSQIYMEPISSSGRYRQDNDEMEVMCENGHQKEKKARASKPARKDASGSKTSVVTDKKRSTKEQPNRNLTNTQTTDHCKVDMGSVQHSVPANSSSSNVSGSHENGTSKQEVKGSPVESVSSSPLRLLNCNTEKVTSARSIVEKDDLHGSGSLTAVSSRRFPAGEDGVNDKKGMEKKNSTLTAIDANEKHSFDQCQAEKKMNSDMSQNTGYPSKKYGKGLSSHSKDKDGTSGSDLNKDKTKASDFSHYSLYPVILSAEMSKSRRDKFDEKSGTPRKTDKFVVSKSAAEATLSENSKGQSQKESRNHDVQDVKSQDKRNYLLQELDNEKLPKQSNQPEVHGIRKSLSLPPLAKFQAETVASLQPDSGPQKQNDVKVFAVEALENAPSQSKKVENQNDQPFSLKHPAPNSPMVRDVEAPSPARRDSSSNAATTAIKEGRKFKHMADRLKGSTESIGYYFQAALKFLHAASLLESGNNEGTKHNDLMQSMHLYSSTAKLCEFCAHEYEKSKDMAAAALAYKCTEVAYMRVVYSSNTSTNRERHELQTALQIVPPGESPSSSASDVDNVNHQATMDKAAVAKVNSSPQVSGIHTINSRSRSSFLRLLNFAQDVNFAMDASRKSRIAFTAATSSLEETPHKEAISLLQKSLDFNFQDVDGLLCLVRIAMEAIGR